MEGILRDFEEKSKAKVIKNVQVLDDDGDEEEEEEPQLKIKGKRKATSSVHPFFTKDEWWKLFGGDYPKLQKFAIRILSQTASSSGCERNWSVFERVHTKRRNRLEHQKLNDLVYVHYSLRLQNRLKADARSYDPIDYQCIDEDLEKWIVEELPGELNGVNEVEDMLNVQEQEPAYQTQENENGYGLVDEDDEGEDGSGFRLLNDKELDAYNTPMF